MPVVHLLRHGHVHNPDKVLYGRLPGFRLSEAGRAMADAVAADLVERAVDIRRVVASPLQRAQETAAPIAAAFAVEIDTEPRIIEAGNIWEGDPLPSGPKDFLNPRALWRLRNPWKPSWGEPYKEQSARMWSALRDAAAATPEGETLMVSHQLPIWVARSTYEHRSLLHDPRSRECGLASLTSFTFEGGEPVAMEYREPAAHIEVPR
ncbi:histidine phosphatase family protein [Demequina capsici]|uniref:Histidine phosphatase family protein n=1 Tax=Demequina capsici TaxID=3075620 RepID=A0AA96FC82_9MICO|nr:MULTISPECIES: histidine phosphatase family protein [unclassified Demequina]WNM24206.1 histidine phosphatase family protein [Demequina sp. OYTSA14]WNM27034.1 histidine phosphatase family protein [Demequina sp. PMTSA13]